MRKERLFLQSNPDSKNFKLIRRLFKMVSNTQKVHGFNVILLAWLEQRNSARKW